MKQRMKFSDLMRIQHDWTPRRWEKEIQIRKMVKLAASEAYGFFEPVFSISRELDGKRLDLVKDAPNFLLANWFNQYAAQTQPATIVNASVTTVAAVANMVGETVNVGGFNGAVAQWQPQAVANQMLGTDTSTTSVHRMYKLIAAIIGTCSFANTNTNLLESWQGTNANQVTQSVSAMTFAANTTSGNPTVGEVGVPLAFISVSGTTIVNCLGTRLAAADGVFSAFSVISSVSLLINWIINYPNP